MTIQYREYAKSRIEYLLKICKLDERDKEALEAAIQALSQEPKADKPKADKLCEVCGYRSGNLCVRPKDYICRVLSQEPTNEKELNKAYTFGHNRGVKAYYNEQLCTVELPEAVFRYILSLVPTEETEQEPCDDAISREAVYSILNEYHIDEEEINSAMDECQNLTVNAITSDVSLLPSVTQKSIECDDAISREAAINIASLHCLTIDETVKAIKNLPSVTQKGDEKNV